MIRLIGTARRKAGRSFCANENDGCPYCGEPSFFVALGVIGLAEEVVNAGVIDAGELDEDGNRDIRCTDLIFAVAGLRDIEHGGHGSLFPVAVFTQVPQARVGDELAQ